MGRSGALGYIRILTQVDLTLPDTVGPSQPHCLASFNYHPSLEEQSRINHRNTERVQVPLVDTSARDRAMGRKLTLSLGPPGVACDSGLTDTLNYFHG